MSTFVFLSRWSAGRPSTYRSYDFDNNPVPDSIKHKTSPDTRAARHHSACARSASALQAREAWFLMTDILGRLAILEL
jgi:hypothetical protein